MDQTMKENQISFALMFLVPTLPLIPFDSPANPIPPHEQLWIDFNDYQRTLYSCYSTGSLGRANDRQRNRFNLTHEDQQRTNILGPKHFIVEVENEALLAKELQDAKIQSTHNSQTSMHSSQPQIFPPPSNDPSPRHAHVKQSDFSSLASYIEDALPSI